jgi:hypothetical protein
LARLAALVAVILLAGSACGGSKPAIHGGSGVVTADGRIGALQIDVSTEAAVEEFAGKPDRIHIDRIWWQGVPRYRALGYGCPQGSKGSTYRCRTVYYFNLRTGRFAAFLTTSTSFESVHGTRYGMTTATAERREGSAPSGPLFAIATRSKNATLSIGFVCGRDQVAAGKQCDPHGVRDLAVESRHDPIGLFFA